MRSFVVLPVSLFVSSVAFAADPPKAPPAPAPVAAASPAPNPAAPVAEPSKAPLPPPSYALIGQCASKATACWMWVRDGKDIVGPAGCGAAPECAKGAAGKKK